MKPESGGNAAPQMQTTGRVIETVRSIVEAELPLDVSEIARQCMLDWFAVALSGCREPLVDILFAQVVDEGGAASASVVGRGARVSPRQAALVNGAMGHALDYDDVNLAALGHVTAAVFPAALAAAEMMGSSGSDLLQAFVAGYETAAIVGRCMGQGHYERGYHGTGTVGIFGAAAACAVLFHLDDEATARALGIAGSQAAGLKAQFGTMCKPLHAGKASENGLLSAQLARRGFLSCPNILEVPQGVMATLGADAEAAPDAFPEPGAWRIRDNLFKFSAACYGTHAAIGAAEDMRREHGLSSFDVESVEVTIDASLDRMCNIPRPTNGLQAKFSVAFNTALALAGEDTSAPSVYSDEITSRPDLISLFERVRVRVVPRSGSNMQSEIRLMARDGRALAGRRDASQPMSDYVQQGAMVHRKFMTLTTPRLGGENAERVAKRIADIEHLADVGRLMAEFRSEGL